MGRRPLLGICLHSSCAEWETPPSSASPQASPGTEPKAPPLSVSESLQGHVAGGWVSTLCCRRRSWTELNGSLTRAKEGNGWNACVSSRKRQEPYTSASIPPSQITPEQNVWHFAGPENVLSAQGERRDCASDVCSSSEKTLPRWRCGAVGEDTTCGATIPQEHQVLSQPLDCPAALGQWPGKAAERGPAASRRSPSSGLSRSCSRLGSKTAQRSRPLNSRSPSDFEINK